MEIGSSSNLTAGQLRPSTCVTYNQEQKLIKTPPPPFYLTTLNFKLLSRHPTNLNIIKENPEIEDAANGMYFWGMLLYKEREMNWKVSWPSDPRGTRLKR
jgi:hypothetical protein